MSVSDALGGGLVRLAAPPALCLGDAAGCGEGEPHMTRYGYDATDLAAAFGRVRERLGEAALSVCARAAFLPPRAVTYVLPRPSGGWSRHPLSH